MGKGNKRLRRQLEKLFEQQKGLCHWCKKPMRLRAEGSKKGIPDPPDIATTEHLDDKNSPLRGKFQGQIRHVAACRKCNNERGVKNALRKKVKFPLIDRLPHDPLWM
jgi:hypothetical protein